MRQKIGKRQNQADEILKVVKGEIEEKLYKKYKLTKKEIDFIESMIRPMELNK